MRDLYRNTKERKFLKFILDEKTWERIITYSKKKIDKLC